eukprot:CAMPEP_0183458512 /NCGR_PEP_ID=MMETSP0370-20130417/133652_1 /TAXON_ID=268820 /ORGANISM="Peridinium aciculiferum, Strain PAER-2" /LENGTH=52 /DNA_ID=CAMNT_0025650295 /DNA_START=18 /DNA_END=172 /DNA_ORIENTATION=+
MPEKSIIPPLKFWGGIEASKFMAPPPMPERPGRPGVPIMPGMPGKPGKPGKP